MNVLYDKYILPKVTHLVCSSRPLRIQREKIVPFATGQVLEIGVGSGLNLPFYVPGRVESLIAMDPSEEMLILAERNLKEELPPVQFVRGYAQEIPLSRDTIDTIVITYTLCSISDVESAFSEFKRVLKRNGKLLFCEHGLAPEKRVQRWQNRLNPFWKKMAGGCNLNRNIPRIIESGTFRIENLESRYIPGPKIASYNYWGVAKPM